MVFLSIVYFYKHITKKVTVSNTNKTLFKSAYGVGKSPRTTEKFGFNRLMPGSNQGVQKKVLNIQNNLRG